MAVQQEMTSNYMVFNIMYLVAALLGVLVVFIFLSRINNFEIPLVSDDRSAFFTIAIIGIIMCGLVMFPSMEMYGFLDPIRTAVMIVGVLTLILVISVFFKFELPIINDDREYLITLVTFMSIQFILTNLQRILDLLGILYNK